MFGNPAAIFLVQSPPFMKGGDNIAVLAAGLPNITGTITYIRGSIAQVEATGAFHVLSNGDLPYGASAQAGTVNISFDASKSNAIYDNSNTVQSPALQLMPQIRF